MMQNTNTEEQNPWDYTMTQCNSLFPEGKFGYILDRQNLVNK